MKGTSMSTVKIQNSNDSLPPLVKNNTPEGLSSTPTNESGSDAKNKPDKDSDFNFLLQLELGTLVSAPRAEFSIKGGNSSSTAAIAQTGHSFRLGVGTLYQLEKDTTIKLLGSMHGAFWNMTPEKLPETGDSLYMQGIMAGFSVNAGISSSLVKDVNWFIDMGAGVSMTNFTGQMKIGTTPVDLKGPDSTSLQAPFIGFHLTTGLGVYLKKFHTFFKLEMDLTSFTNSVKNKAEGRDDSIQLSNDFLGAGYLMIGFSTE